MNIENILSLADFIEKLPHHNSYDTDNKEPSFTLVHYNYGCGSPACIAGWAAHRYKNGNLFCQDPDTIDSDALDYLGLDRSFTYLLFSPEDIPSLSSVTPKDAATALRNIAKGANTSETIWSHVYERGNEE